MMPGNKDDMAKISRKIPELCHNARANDRIA